MEMLKLLLMSLIEASFVLTLMLKLTLKRTSVLMRMSKMLSELKRCLLLRHLDVDISEAVLI